jgi:hypothetical protein
MTLRVGDEVVLRESRGGGWTVERHGDVIQVSEGGPRVRVKWKWKVITPPPGPLPVRTEPYTLRTWCQAKRLVMVGNKAEG